MDSAAMSVRSSADAANNLISRPELPTVDISELDRSTPSRPAIPGRSSAASTASTSSSSFADSRIFDNELSGTETPLTPPDEKELSLKEQIYSLSGAALKGPVSRFSLNETARGEESHNDYSGRRSPVTIFNELDAKSGSEGLEKTGLEEDDGSPSKRLAAKLNVRMRVGDGTTSISESQEVLKPISLPIRPARAPLEVNSEVTTGSGSPPPKAQQVDGGRNTASLEVAPTLDSQGRLRRRPPRIASQSSVTDLNIDEVGASQNSLERKGKKSRKGPLKSDNTAVKGSVIGPTVNGVASSQKKGPKKPGMDTQNLDGVAVGLSDAERTTKETDFSPPADEAVTSLHNLSETVLEKPATSTPELNKDEAGVAADLASEKSFSISSCGELDPGPQDVDDNTDSMQASIPDSSSEYQLSMTSSHLSDFADQYPTNDVDMTEDTETCPIEINEESTAAPVNDDNDPDFKRFSEDVQSTNDIKVAILALIGENDKVKKPQTGKTIPKRDDGFIYIYETNKSKGHLKIGRTSGKHGKRTCAWEKQCKYKTVQVPDSNDKKFAHFQMVEGLIHKELSNQRRTFKCARCRKLKKPNEPREHEEWFDVTKSHALEVVERWRGWVVYQQPFEADGTLRGIWRWKHDQARMAKTPVDFAEWVVLSWFDTVGYFWYDIDLYLAANVPGIVQQLRATLFVYICVSVLLCYLCGFTITLSCETLIVLFARRYGQGGSNNVLI